MEKRERGRGHAKSEASSLEEKTYPHASDAAIHINPTHKWPRRSGGAIHDKRRRGGVRRPLPPSFLPAERPLPAAVPGSVCRPPPAAGPGFFPPPPAPCPTAGVPP